MNTSNNTIRHHTLYVKVCNLNASGASDTSNCSDSASTIIKIDKKPPYIDLKTKNICSRKSDGMVYTTPILKVTDEGSQLKSVKNVRNDRSTRASDTCSRSNSSSAFDCNFLGLDYNTLSIKFNISLRPDVSYFTNGSYSWESNSLDMLIEVESIETCDLVDNCTSLIHDQDGNTYNNHLTPNESTGLMSCKKWSESH